jgi:hypothetical protein
MEKHKNSWMYEFETKNSGGAKKFAILKPNRKLREDGELFYATETSRFAKAGVLPKAAWNTILSNGGGSISEQDRELYGSLLIKFRDKSFDLQSILIKGESERTDVEKSRVDSLIEELDSVKKDIQAFEASQIAIFENTAEAKARNRTILWWVMFLSYRQDENGNFVALFEGNEFNEKLLKYDSLEDDSEKNEFLLGIIRRLTYLITLWFLGRAETKEDFSLFDKNYISENEEENIIDKTEENKNIESASSSQPTPPNEADNVIEKIQVS